MLVNNFKQTSFNIIGEKLIIIGLLFKKNFFVTIINNKKSYYLLSYLHNNSFYNHSHILPQLSINCFNIIIIFVYY